MVHKARNNGLPFWNKKRNDQDQVVIAFEAYGKLSSVTVRPMTVISALSNIREDICTRAHQKRAAMILLPIHKHQRVDVSMESLGHTLHSMNESVLSHAPCSVGILIDRGLGGTSQVSSSDVSYKIVVPFFGGRDDREALAYGMRMAEHPGILLTVVKFTAPLGKTLTFGAKLVGIDVNKDKKVLTEADESVKDEKAADEAVLTEFFSTHGQNKEKSLMYEERLVTSKADIMTALK
ncbi:Cation/H(+) antiporter like [Quillaja saponaria]|uniref:Cation/H(+) antiporter like n=1 Tax=Quillaja saponaria TaxID=32244 RepID=A0AAD7LC16_QUISA|nr:Cation/H(+) antiporter like [Quillaja saponaria]